MKLRLLATTIALGLAVAAQTAVRAQDDDRPKTDLEKKMDVINRSMRKLKKQIGDSASNDSSIQAVAAIHDAATAALDMTPEKEKDLPPDQQPAFHAQFEKGMKDFIAQVDQMAAALKAGDNATAAKIYQGLGQLEKKDHKQFRKPHKD
jgi:soluble cytochrome b562